MRPTAPAVLMTCLALAACAGIGPHPYDRSAEAHAVVVGTHAADPADDGIVRTFRVTAIDGWPVHGNVDPSQTLGVDQRDTLPVGRKVRVDFEGLLRFYNPGRTLFKSPRRAEGHVDLTPVDGASYTVRGEVGPQGTTVWLEDDATHQRVGEAFTEAAPKPADTPDYRTTTPGL